MYVKDEREVGHYQGQIMRHSGGQWSVTIPPLQVVTTNYRLILWPQTRKPYQPASIPCTYIASICEIELGRRFGYRIKLKSGHCLHLVIPGGNGEHMLEDIRRMGKLPDGWRHLFSERLTQADVDRLITYVKRI